MTRLVRNLLIGAAAAMGLALVWRVMRAREIAALAARRGEEMAARGGSPRAASGPAQFGALPVAAVAVDAEHTVPAVPVAIVGGGAAGTPGTATPPSSEMVEATLRRRGLRIRGRHYGLKVVAATIGLTLLVLFGAGFAAFKILTGGGGGDTVGLDDFGSSLDGALDGSTTTLSPGDTAPVDTGAAADAAAGTGTDPAAASGSEAGGDGSAAAAMLRPPDGGYSYAASGYMETKVLGFSARTAPSASVPATVSAASASCWTLDKQVQPDKNDISHYCNPAAGTLTSPGGVQKQKQFGLGIVATVTCSPVEQYVVAGMQPGQQFPADCKVQNSGTISSTMMLDGTNTFVGIETVDVGGTAVSAYHVRQDQQASGKDVNGPSRTDYWFATSNGMLVKSVRQQRLTGFAAYNEDTTFVLKSMTPG